MVAYDTLLGNATYYNKTRQSLLRNATKVYYKIRQLLYYNKQQFYHKMRYKMRQLLENGTLVTKCVGTSVIDF